MDKKLYKLTILEDEEYGGNILALLSEEDVEIIKKSIAGTYGKEYLILDAEGDENEVGIIDKISEATDIEIKIPIFKKTMYELYKVDWMRRVSADTQMDAIKDYFEGLTDFDETYTLRDYIEEFGYNSNLYGCYSEFCETELKDEEYVLSLIGDNKALMEVYNEYKKGWI